MTDIDPSKEWFIDEFGLLHWYCRACSEWHTCEPNDEEVAEWEARKNG